jgi:hypothetical protein
MKTQTTSKNETKKAAGSAEKPATGANTEKPSKVQKDAEARSRGESPVANKLSERSPRQENL